MRVVLDGDMPAVVAAILAAFEVGICDESALIEYLEDVHGFEDVESLLAELDEAVN